MQSLELDIAEAAFIWSFTRVNPDMVLQVAPRRKLFGADITLEALFFMASFDVASAIIIDVRKNYMLQTTSMSCLRLAVDRALYPQCGHKNLLPK